MSDERHITRSFSHNHRRQRRCDSSCQNLNSPLLHPYCSPHRRRHDLLAGTHQIGLGLTTSRRRHESAVSWVHTSVATRASEYAAAACARSTQAFTAASRASEAVTSAPTHLARTSAVAPPALVPSSLYALNGLLKP